MVATTTIISSRPSAAIFDHLFSINARTVYYLPKVRALITSQAMPIG
jgi:hypothetical protein